MNKNYEFLKGVKGINQGIIPFLPPDSEDVNERYLNLFFETMFERQEIWYKRNILKSPIPWTEDEILRDYKFTNVYRELDRSSQYIIKNILTNYEQSAEDVVFRTLTYRLFNIPDTFEHPKSEVCLQPYVGFNSTTLWSQVIDYRRRIDNPWHTAYMMNIVAIAQKPSNWNEAVSGKFKDYVYCVLVAESLHEAIPYIINSKSIQELIKNLEKIKGVSSFMSHEFFLDLILIGKYWKSQIIHFTENDFTNVGPGASLGIKLIFPSLEPKEQIHAIECLRDLSELYLSKIGDFKYIDFVGFKKLQPIYNIGKHNITLHQIEFFLCEFSKYWKMLIGQGKQRSKFTTKTK